LYFTLHLAGELGFRIQGEYSPVTPVLDLQEGQYISDKPFHPHYIDGNLAKVTSQINSINFYSDLEQVQLNRNTRGELLIAYQNYMALHVQNYGVIKTLPVLQEIFS
jgi:DNA repair protein RecO (recombination protein O)